MRIDIPTMITTALIVAVVTFALTLAYTNTGDAEVIEIEVEKIVEVERKLTVEERRAVSCYQLFNVWVDIPSGTAGEQRALDRAWDECVR